MDEWISKLWSIIWSSKGIIHVTTWMNLGNMILSERSQSQMTRSSMTPVCIRADSWAWHMPHSSAQGLSMTLTYHLFLSSPALAPTRPNYGQSWMPVVFLLPKSRQSTCLTAVAILIFHPCLRLSALLKHRIWPLLQARWVLLDCKVVI